MKKKIINSVLPHLECGIVPTLYVIGNGFDIAHGIRSRYSDFRKFEVSKKKSQLVSLMDEFFSHSSDFWFDIEKALGEYSTDAIIDFCNPEEEFDIDHMTRSEASYVDSPDYIFKPSLDEFRKEFHEWVDSIDISDTEPFMRISPEAKFLTFNYTETLEDVYGIESGNILHIHGKRTTDDDYIIGHCDYRNSDSAYDYDDILFKQKTRAKVMDWMNDYYKDVDSIIARNRDFFDGLADIRQVVVLGHSVNEVDRKYFSEIANIIGKEKPWMFSFYSDDDLRSIRKFIDAEKLTNARIIHFDDMANA